jgi:hypothetical protein
MVGAARHREADPRRRQIGSQGTSPARRSRRLLTTLPRLFMATT